MNISNNSTKFWFLVSLFIIQLMIGVFEVFSTEGALDAYLGRFKLISAFIFIWELLGFLILYRTVNSSLISTKKLKITILVLIFFAPLFIWLFAAPELNLKIKHSTLALLTSGDLHFANPHLLTINEIVKNYL